MPLYDAVAVNSKNGAAAVRSRCLLYELIGDCWMIVWNLYELIGDCWMIVWNLYELIGDCWMIVWNLYELIGD